MFLCMSVFCLSAAPSFAQRSMVISLYNSGLKAYERGNYREALRIFRQCESMAGNIKHSPRESAQLLYSLGETLRCLGQYKEAEETLKKSMAIIEQLPRGQRYFLYHFNSLALIYQAEGRFTEAEQFWKQSESLSGKGDLRSLLPVGNLARHYYLWGKTGEQKEYVEKTEYIAARSPKTEAIAYAKFNRAQLDEQLGNFKKAEEEYRQALANCAAVNGPTHPYCGFILMHASDLFRKESRYPEAEKCLRDALKVFEAQYPSEHPDIAETLVKLGRVLCDQGKYSQAKTLVQSALKTEQNLLNGEDNLITAKAKDCLGNILRQDGRYQESKKVIEEALEIQRRILGADNIEVAITMRDLALVLEEEADFEQAESLLQNSLAIIERQSGPDHPERAAAANALAHAYFRDQKYEEAEALFKKAMELSERVLGPNNYVTASGARDLGNLYVKQKKFNDAEVYLKKSLAIDESIYGQDAPRVAGDLTALASVYGEQGNTEKASELLKRAAQIKNVLPGGRTAETLPEIKANPDADRPVGDKWALVVGISTFKDSSINLKYAAKDATDFKNFLINKENFKADHVKLLTDESASRENIIGLLGEKWLATHVKPDDLVVVYVSSHGSAATDQAGGTNFLVAHDTNKNSLAATGIPMQWLSNIVTEQVKSDRIILILDVCHSGAVSEGQKGLTRQGVDSNAMRIGKGQMVLCSSLADQISWESKNYENSVFTHCLMEALQSDEGKTSMLDAFKRLKVLVESEVLRDRGDLQTPVLNTKHWLGKDPVLAVEPLKSAEK
jgi:tetratricopeptide (TPR) repeat protein